MLFGFSDLQLLHSQGGEDTTIYFIGLSWAASEIMLPGTKHSIHSTYP